MAAPAGTEDQWRRRRRDDDDLDDDDDEPLVGEEEEGEIVPGCHSETDTDEYYNRNSPIEYDDDAISSRRAAATVVPANNDSNEASSEALGWGGTGKRGRSGMSVSPNAEPDHPSSMPVVATAAPKPVLQPVPLAFAPPSIPPPSSSVPTASAAGTNNISGQSSSSAQSVHDDAAVDTAVAGAGAASPPDDEATVHHHQPLAPPPPPPPPARPAAPAAGRQNPDGYTCPKCGMWFATHQGLGGHSVGHKHRERAELVAAAVPGCGRCDGGGGGAGKQREERVHVCGDCGAEFATGVQLGGHKRKHWAGAPIVPKKKPRAVVVVQPLPPPEGRPARAADVMLSLPLPIKTDEVAPPAVETNPLPPATSSPVPGRVRLFGVDIVPAVQTPQAQQGGSRLRLRLPAGSSSSHRP